MLQHKNMEKYWEKFKKPWENIGKTYLKSWENLEKIVGDGLFVKKCLKINCLR
jgi:hypothetical protein